jgi:sugar transferase (PEP-CTERM/EpsH1 system associated)
MIQNLTSDEAGPEPQASAPRLPHLHFERKLRQSVPITIVHVLHSFEIGGLENGVANLINTLDWGVYKHKLLCITRAGRLVKRLRRPDVEIVELGKASGSDWRMPLKIARELRRMKPSIVHTRNWGTIDGIIAARLSGVPVVIHGEHGRTMTEIGRGSRKRNLVRKLLAPMLDAYITVSEELRSIALEIGIPGKKIHTICNGVDLDRFSFKADKRTIRLENGLPQDAFIVGCVGRLDPIKNYESLIQILPGLIKDFPKISLLIVGDGPRYSALNELPQQLGIAHNVVFAGARDDVPLLLKAMDIFALPSLSEGISNTVLEAMASGLPVVATRVGGNIELVRDKETGFLVEPEDASDLTIGIRAYLNNPPLIREHGSAGMKRVEEHFSLRRMVSAYDSLYRNLLKAKNRETGELYNTE